MNIAAVFKTFIYESRAAEEEEEREGEKEKEGG